VLYATDYGESAVGTRWEKKTTGKARLKLVLYEKRRKAL